MNRLVLPSVIVCLLHSLSFSASVQLPPEVEIDRLLLAAEQHGTDGEHEAMLESLNDALGLAREHSFEVPGVFWYQRAAAAERSGYYRTAIESATSYLEVEGRGGEYYREILELMMGAESEIERLAEIARGMEFVLVPPGEFQMGSTSESAPHDTRPVTRVRITKEFYLGRHEVTRGLWKAVMATDLSRFDECDECPVESVRMDDIAEFLRRLNQTNESTRGSVYRLPTEAEWEYAARGGTDRERYNNALDAIAWYEGNSGGRPRPVGRKLPNIFGLYDMLGNVGELVKGHYSPYPGGSVVDYQGPDGGSHRVWRGCDWSDAHDQCWVANRYHSVFESGGNLVGFRIVRSVE